MNMLVPCQKTGDSNYILIDSGDGYKLEQIGGVVFARPDAHCLWARSLPERVWERAQAQYVKNKQGAWEWVFSGKQMKDAWLFNYEFAGAGKVRQELALELHCSKTKNIGVFPEQMVQWSWMMQKIRASKSQVRVLNLFGYTGAATLAAAAAGAASITHVDAARSAINHAKKNQEASNQSLSSIRWIVDDCAEFVKREIRRGARYDALIIDPPAFGRDAKGGTFVFEKHIVPLLSLCKKLLVDDPTFIIFNAYASDYSAVVLKNLLADQYPKRLIEYGELGLAEQQRGYVVPCSIFARL